MGAFGLANKEFPNMLPNVKVDAFIKKHFIEDTNRDTAGKTNSKMYIIFSSKMLNYYTLQQE
jgi:hypothetical protein